MSGAPEGSVPGVAATGRDRRWPDAPTSPTILVVDPQGPRRRRFADRLAGAAGRVLDAPSAELALYVVSSSAVDLVVTAPDLPGMGGEVLLEELRRRGGPPVVALLPLTESDRRAAWLDAGAAGCVAPAEDASTVAARLRAIMRRP